MQIEEKSFCPQPLYESYSNFNFFSTMRAYYKIPNRIT